MILRERKKMIDRKRKIVKARGRGERERKSDHECVLKLLTVPPRFLGMSSSSSD